MQNKIGKTCSLINVTGMPAIFKVPIIAKITYVKYGHVIFICKIDAVKLLNSLIML